MHSTLSRLLALPPATAVAMILCLLPLAGTASDEAPRKVATTCVECHGDGEAAIPGWPPIKFMTREEIKTRLTTYRDQLVPGSRMGDVSHDFSDEDIDAIAEYFARRRLQPH